MKIEEFIKKAREVHGDKYDYSKVDCKNINVKTCIICPEHGEFWQTPYRHYNGQGCPECAKIKRGLNRRTTIDEFIRRSKEIHGNKYDYSKVVYEGTDKNVCIICPKHGEFWQTPNTHLHGHGCPKCGKEIAGQKASVTEALTLEQFIEKARKVHGDKYDYSKVEYKNAHTKVCILCPEHGEFWQKPGNHLDGNGCPRCVHENINLTTEEFIEKAKKIHGDKYDYSKVDVKNCKTKVCIICHDLDRNGKEIGEFWITPSSHLSGCGCPRERRGIDENVWEERICPICGKKFKIRKKYEKITCSEECRLKYVELHRDEIIGRMVEKNKLAYQNKTEEERKQIYKKVKETCLKRYGVDSFMKTTKGREQASKTMSKFKKEWDKKYTDEVLIPKYRQICENDDLELLEFRNRYDCTVKCKKCGNVFEVKTLGYLKENMITNRCKICHPYEQLCGPTKQEIELAEFLDENNIKYYKNCRSQITPQEIDFYLPDYNIGIEMDGLYWHCEDQKPKNYHLEKTEKCLEKGIRLIHIFEDEWNNKKDICKSRIMNILGINQDIINVDKCKIKLVTKNEYKDFINDNDLEEYIAFNVCYGLYYNDELVSLMSFRKQRKTKNKFELLRFCNKLNTSVVGGASKLLNHFIKEHKPEQIISYADRRWNNGNLYEKIGFTFDHISKPNYYYFVDGDRRNRFEFRKSVLVERYGCPDDMSEHKFCLSQHWYRIYDCGNLCYIWNRQN